MGRPAPPSGITHSIGFAIIISLGAVGFRKTTSFFGYLWFVFILSLALDSRLLALTTVCLTAYGCFIDNSKIFISPVPFS
jgi:hypothetical protein